LVSRTRVARDNERELRDKEGDIDRKYWTGGGGLKRGEWYSKDLYRLPFSGIKAKKRKGELGGGVEVGGVQKYFYWESYGGSSVGKKYNIACGTVLNQSPKKKHGGPRNEDIFFAAGIRNGWKVGGGQGGNEFKGSQNGGKKNYKLPGTAGLGGKRARGPKRPKRGNQQGDTRKKEVRGGDEIEPLVISGRGQRVCLGPKLLGCQGGEGKVAKKGVTPHWFIKDG